METQTTTFADSAERTLSPRARNSHYPPAVERVLHALGRVQLPRPSVLRLVRQEIRKARFSGASPGLDGTVLAVREQIARLVRCRLRPVINATGVLIHTNFGRAPLPAEAIAAISRTATEYNNLEFDLAAGKRGSRAAYLEHQLSVLCEAQAATIVNNCAAALVLVVSHFTRRRREVIISRGELVQIGGGFRIPEILESAGARIREVGTTNHTKPEDYANAISKETGLILKVHQSNFVMRGFVSAVGTQELAGIARHHRLPFVEDLGAGAVWDTADLPGVPHEVAPRECLKAGASIVIFSGDKLLGGPQAGVLAGARTDIEGIKRHPLFRAVRCGKLVLPALEVVVDLHLEGESAHRIPLLAMANTSIDELRVRAENIRGLVMHLRAKITVEPASSEMGGGGLPDCAIPSIALVIDAPGLPPLTLMQRLLAGDPPVAGSASRGRVRLDLRTVFPDQDIALANALRAAFQL